MSRSHIPKGKGFGDPAMIKYALLENWANLGVICHNMLEIIIKEACFLADNLIKYVQY